MGTWKTAQTITPYFYDEFMPESVEVLPFTNPGDQKTALLAGSLDMCGTTLVTAITAASKGEPVKIVTSLCLSLIHIFPSCAVGSAVAGGLSMLFGCTLMAPHGGVFVFPVVGNPLFYVVSLLIGSVVGMILLAILKKPLKKEAA